jgi:hypothetical protein
MRNRIAYATNRDGQRLECLLLKQIWHEASAVMLGLIEQTSDEIEKCCKTCPSTLFTQVATTSADSLNCATVLFGYN